MSIAPTFAPVDQALHDTPTVRNDSISDPVLADLNCLDGFNMIYGLKLLNGQTGKYLELLGSFVKTHADDMSRLATILVDEKSDRAAPRQIAHALKGSSAALGAVKISKLAAHLEAFFRAGHDQAIDMEAIRQNMDAINQEFAALAAALPHQPLAALSNFQAPDSNAIETILTKLDTLLAESDFNATTFFEENAEPLSSILGPDFDDLAVQVANFEFPKAQQKLRALSLPSTHGENLIGKL